MGPKTQSKRSPPFPCKSAQFLIVIEMALKEIWFKFKYCTNKSDDFFLGGEISFNNLSVIAKHPLPASVSIFKQIIFVMFFFHLYFNDVLLYWALLLYMYFKEIIYFICNMSTFWCDFLTPWAPIGKCCITDQGYKNIINKWIPLFDINWEKGGGIRKYNMLSCLDPKFVFYFVNILFISKQTTYYLDRELYKTKFTKLFSSRMQNKNLLVINLKNQVCKIIS